MEDKLWRQSPKLRSTNGCQTEDNEKTCENATTKRKRNIARCLESRIGITEKKDRRIREQKKWE